MNTAATTVTNWGVAAWTAFAAGMAGLLMWVPRLIGAIVILLVGWAISSVCYNLTCRVLKMTHFDRLLDRTGISAGLARARVRTSPVEAIATVVKWAVLLVTWSVAADALALPGLSAGIGAVIAYIPNVLAAAVIMGVGLLLAGFVRDLVKGAASGANLGMADVLGEVTYWAIAVFATLGAIGQLRIAPTLVQTIYTGIIAAAALAAGLAFGLGLREQARDVTAGRTVSETLKPGDRVTVGTDIHGQIQSIGAITTLIARDDGSLVTVPNRDLVESRVTIGSGSTAHTRLRVTFAPEAPTPTTTTPSTPGRSDIVNP